jgi:hypothetical protein
VQIKAQKMADKLWAAEKILRTGSFGALLLWLQQVRQASVRRLHLAAQSSEPLFVVVRPEWAATHASPATLRLGLRRQMKVWKSKSRSDAARSPQNR